MNWVSDFSSRWQRVSDWAIAHHLKRLLELSLERRLKIPDSLRFGHRVAAMTEEHQENIIRVVVTLGY